MRLLTDGELQATVSPSPRPSGVADDLWDLVEAYVEAIPDADWQGHVATGPGTPTTYRMRGRWQHVLVETADRRVLMVVVVDLTDRVVHGHRLLDLRP